jgi:hypothetical protein
MAAGGGVIEAAIRVLSYESFLLHRFDPTPHNAAEDPKRTFRIAQPTASHAAPVETSDEYESNKNNVLRDILAA